MKSWVGRELMVVLVCRAVCALRLAQSLLPVACPTKLEKPCNVFFGIRQIGNRQMQRGFILLTPTGGRRVGFLIEVAFRLTELFSLGKWAS